MNEHVEGESWTTIPALLQKRITSDGDRIAIDDTEAGVQLTFAELGRTVERTCAGLLALGVERGDAVALWAPNMWEWIVAALATHGAGAALVPLNTRFKGREAAFVLERSRARVLFAVRDFLGTEYPDLIEPFHLPDLHHTVLLRGAPHEGELTLKDLASKGAGLDPRVRSAEIHPDDPSDIMFTSGTTGAPKGVVCTHAQSLRTFHAWSEVVGLGARDRYLVVNPFFHTFGYKAGWLSGLIQGCVILPHAVFDPNGVLARIPQDRVTMLPGPPTLFQKLLAHPELSSFDLSSLRLAVTGAAAIPTQLILDMRSILGFDTVITGYGLTEACGVATMCRFDDDPETIAQTSGRAIEGVEVQVVDDHGEELPRGEAGEIWVRGFNIMVCYLDNPTATAEAVTPEGWLKTGDIGVMDPQGYIKITDRKKDMFIVGGFNAYPAEIEALLSAHPDVAQVAVVGMPHPQMGEVAAAFVIKTAHSVLTEDGLVAWSRDNMANYKVPRHIEFIDALPTNALGKVTRFVLKERLRA